MLQFNTKGISLVKSDPKVGEAVMRIEKNLTNLGILSGKAFKLL